MDTSDPNQLCFHVETENYSTVVLVADEERLQHLQMNEGKRTRVRNNWKC